MRTQLPHHYARTAAWLAVLAWAATIIWLSSRGGEEIEEMNVLKISDKLAHFGAFFVGAALFTIALRWSTAWPWRNIALAGALALALFGASDEYHQTFTPNRSGGDVLDWLADALGATGGATLTALLYARSTRPRSPAPAESRGA